LQISYQNSSALEEILKLPSSLVNSKKPGEQRGYYQFLIHSAVMLVAAMMSVLSFDSFIS